MTSNTTHDLIVIGAGPAGMAAAYTGAGLGLRTVLLDEQARPGGQIYRNVMIVDRRVASILGTAYMEGSQLLQALHASRAEVRHNAVVWDVAQDLTVTAHQGSHSFQLRAPQIIAATGAMERASPIPGWTLPGVMNAGAAQIAMKSGGNVPAGRIVLIGGGPLLFLIACQLLDAGAQIAAIIETSPSDNFRKALRHLPSALRGWRYLAKGVNMLLQLRLAGVPRHTAAIEIEILGQRQAEQVRFRTGKQQHLISADVVLLHHGVIPNTQLSRLLRLEHRWSEEQLAWHVVTDQYGQTSLPGLRVSGDCVAIGGALAAKASGQLAALASAQAIGRISVSELEQHAKPIKRALAAEWHVRPFLDALYRPPRFITHPADSTIVCRCEEVEAGRIREMARLGCQGPNQTKFFSRCGMGPCQGRVCGNVVTQLLASELGKTPQEVGAYRIRAPLKPLPLSSLAAMASIQDLQLHGTEPNSFLQENSE